MGQQRQNTGRLINIFCKFVLYGELGLFHVRYTSKKSSSGVSVYAISLAWPKGGELVLAAVTSTPQTTVSMLGYGPSLNWTSRGPSGGIVVHVPAIPDNEVPCHWAWVFKLDYVAGL